MSSEKLILSLYDYSGNWSKPYREAGYRVEQIDIKLGRDIFTERPSDYPKTYGILAAPPCTHFAVAGAKHFAAKDLDGRTEKDVQLILRTLEFIEQLKPNFWCLENPVGRLNRLVPGLCMYGPRYFQPYWYGDKYRKKTGLWGNYNFPRPTDIVEPGGIRKGQPDKWYSRVGGKSEATKEYRSMTPMGFAYAFFNANR